MFVFLDEKGYGRQSFLAPGQPGLDLGVITVFNSQFGINAEGFKEIAFLETFVSFQLATVQSGRADVFSGRIEPFERSPGFVDKPFDFRTL